MWCECMVAVIYDERKNRLSNDIEYIITPPNALQVRFNHSEYASENQSKLSVEILGKLKFQINKLQIRHLALVALKLNEIIIKREATTFRPDSDPLQDKKEWWKYTFRRITNNFNKSSVK